MKFALGICFNVAFVVFLFWYSNTLAPDGKVPTTLSTASVISRAEAYFSPPEIDKNPNLASDSAVNKDTLGRNKNGQVNPRTTLHAKPPQGAYIAGVPPIRLDLDTSPQRILMLGESMFEGLYLALLPYSKKNKHFLKCIIWYGSSTKDWGARNDTITKLIEKYKPTLVMMSVGANELFIRDIIETRDVYMQNIAKQLQPHNYLWIGPPNWKKGTGINDLILKYVPSAQYYESRKLKYQRAKDGAHPTRASSRMWADSIARWIMEESPYPIRLEKP